MRKISISSALIISSFLSYSQEKEQSDSPLQLKYTWGGKFHLVDDSGLRVKSKLNKQEMYDLLSGYPAGKDLYTQFRQTTTLSRVFVWSGTATAVAGLGCLVGSLDFDEGEIKNNGLFWTGIGLEGATLLFEGLGIGFEISAKTKGYKLSSAYNKHQEKYSFNFGATKHGIGLTCNF